MAHASFPQPVLPSNSYAYTSVAQEPVSHQPPRSEVEWNNWWQCDYSWEEPFLSRRSWDPVWTAVEKSKVFDALNQRVERILVRRMLPQYKKSANRIVVGSLGPDLWKTWVRVISNGAPFREVKERKLSVPSHLPTKESITYTKITWKVYMPKLSPVRSQWYRKKWVDRKDGTHYRAHMTSLSFGYNPITEVIRADMEYKTEFFDDDNLTWCPI